MEGSGAMKSIDNLREYALTAASVNATTRAVLAGYIDEIEREVADNERFRTEAEPFADRLREAVGERADVTLFGVDYTPLPVDADGNTIHVGDTIEWDDGETFDVIGIGGNSLFYIDGEGQCQWADTEAKHHPTVESVLRRFSHLMDMAEMGACDVSDAFDYATSMLRLTGGEDE